ncbi:MAG: SpoIVB peptidase [Candidatus Scatosoma sp.]
MGGRKFIISGILAALCAVISPIPDTCGNSARETSAHGCAQIEAKAAEREFYVGGMPAGFTLGVGGAQVIGLSQVMCDTGSYSPAAKAGLKTGDVIEKVSGIRVRTTAELNEAIGRFGGKEVTLTVRRHGESAEVSLRPVKDKVTGKYKIGILARDSVSGIGTVTYIEKDSRRFGSLGHPVAAENGGEFSGGDICSCCIVGVKKGVRGKAGELRGTFLNAEKIGTGDKITDCGIFGTFNETFALTGNLTAYAASADEVSIGNACIYSTVEGESPKKYEIDIVKVDKNNRGNKNFVIKITDDELLEKTGGIVQGMSGSPILQNGKLVGAVTHVFINDPTRGYGVAIETMLKSAE